MEKKRNGVNQCQIANYDLILTVLLLFALIFFKDPQQYDHPPIYGGHVPSVQIKCRYNSRSSTKIVVGAKV